MNNDDRISGEQGSIKPEETLTDIVRSVAYTRGDKSPMRAAANGALIRWLKELEASDVEGDREAVEFALSQEGFDGVNEFVEAFMDAGEPVMGVRMDLADLGTEDLQIEDTPGFELQDAGDQDG